MKSITKTCILSHELIGMRFGTLKTVSVHSTHAVCCTIWQTAGCHILRFLYCILDRYGREATGHTTGHHVQKPLGSFECKIVLTSRRHVLRLWHFLFLLVFNYCWGGWRWLHNGHRMDLFTKHQLFEPTPHSLFYWGQKNETVIFICIV